MQQPQRDVPKDKHQLLDELCDKQSPRIVPNSPNHQPGDKNPEQDPWLAFGLHLDRLFEIPVYDAPGLSLVGAQVNPARFGTTGLTHLASATGKALDTCNATISCIGEAVEFTSQHLRGDEQIVRGAYPPDVEHRDKQKLDRFLELAGYNLGDAGDQRNWVRVQRLRREGPDAWLPAELFYRGLPDTGKPPLSKLGLGCASGPSLGWAMLHGLIELIERDAVALWWVGGAAPRPISLAEPDMNPVAGILSALRGESAHRGTILLDITTDLGIPCVVAASHNSDGRGLAFGFGARLNLAEAAGAALLEMAQMEMAVHIVKLKRRQQGESALSSEEQMALRRYDELDLTDVIVRDERHPSGSVETRLSIIPGSRQTMSDGDRAFAIADHLHQHDIEVFALDITRPDIAIPAIKLTSADLQPMPSDFETARLRTMLAATGGGPGHKHGIELF